MPDSLRNRALSEVIRRQLLLAALLFLTAGSLRYWEGWVYWALVSLCVLFNALYFLQHDPALVRRRIKVGPAAERKKSQKVIQAVAGALVCAVGANDPRARELDNVVLQRSAFVCCDSVEQARIESGDLIEPVAAGVLDWLEVHELQEVVAGQLPGRQTDADIVLFKSNGLAAWDVAIAAAVVERARERGVGREL